MHHPLPIKAASPRSTSITSTAGWVPILSWAQHEDETDRFKFPARPDSFISPFTHRFSTYAIERT